MSQRHLKRSQLPALSFTNPGAYEIKIIEAAEHVFAPRSFNGATLESIAEQVGLSK